MRTIKLIFSSCPVLALGGDIYSAPCFISGSSAILAEPLGDLSLLENQALLEQTLKIIIKEPPSLVVSDIHPGYFSTAIASRIAKRYGVPHKKVQHHMAHVAGAAAEYGLREYTGISCDGMGLGIDDTIWGGEVFSFRNRFLRIGSLQPQPQMGGDAATIFPRKMLFGILAGFMDADGLRLFFDESEVKVGLAQLKSGYNVLKTSSAGRILDAVSALLGVCDKRTYEGEPAIRLEKFAQGPGFDLDPLIIKRDRLILDTSSLFRFIIDNLDKDRKRLAATAQIYIAKGLVSIAKTAKQKMVFSGGVAYNKMISGYMTEKGVLLHKEIPPGDAGLAFGQAVLGALSKIS